MNSFGADTGKSEIRQLLDSSLVEESLELTVQDVLNASLDRDTDVEEVTRRVMASIIEGLGHQKDGVQKIRSVSEIAVLTVARRWGNVVHAGRATVEATKETAERVGMNRDKATEQASIGAADGVLRVGPVAYPHLKRELSELVANVDEVIERGRNLPAVYEPPREPVIIVAPGPEEVPPQIEPVHPEPPAEFGAHPSSTTSPQPEPASEQSSKANTSPEPADEPVAVAEPKTVGFLSRVWAAVGRIFGFGHTKPARLAREDPKRTRS